MTVRPTTRWPRGNRVITAENDQMFANNLPKKWQLPYPDVPNNGAQGPQADRQRCQRHLPVAEETVIALGDGSLVPAASAADLRPDDSSPEAGTLRVPEAKDTAAESLFISRLRAATGLAFQIWSR